MFARTRLRTLSQATIAVACASISVHAQADTVANTARGSRTAVDSVNASAPASRVLTRKDIEAAGWHRLAELLEGATGTSRFSVDGFTYGVAGDRLPPAGISAESAPEWLVLVDGVRVPVSAFGLQFAELLPITLLQIDSARFSTGPVLVAGLAAPRGALELFTSQREKGFDGGLSYLRGDETGDPGPFRYTGLASPNVEKIGPLTSAYIGYGRARGGLSLSYHGATFTSSDTNIARRIPAGTFTERNQYNESNTIAARARVRVAGAEHAFSLSVGTQHGLIFVPHHDGEGDLKLTLATGSLSGSTKRGGTHVRYVLSAASMPIYMRSVVLASLESSRRNNYSALIAGERTVRNTNLSISASATHWQLNLPSDRWHSWSERVAASASRRSGQWFSEFNLGLTHATAISSQSSASAQQDAQLLMDYSASLRFRASERSALLVTAAQLQPVSAFDGSWTNAAQFRAVAFSHPPVMRRMLAGLEHRGRVLNGNGFLTASHVSRWMLTEFGGASSTAKATGPQSITLIGAQADLQTDTTRSFVARIALSASAPTGGTSFMRGSIRSTSANDARLTFSYRPVAGFRTSAFLHAVSGTRWQASNGASALSTPPRRRLDLSAEKWAFDRRLRAQLIFRNVLNRPERYHPLGAQWNFRTEVSMTLTASSL